MRAFIIAVSVLAGCRSGGLSSSTQASTGGETYGGGSGGVDIDAALDSVLNVDSRGSGSDSGPLACDPPCARCTQECTDGQCVDTGLFLCPDGECETDSHSCDTNCDPPCDYCAQTCLGTACYDTGLVLCPDGISCELQARFCPSSCDPPCHPCTEYCTPSTNECHPTTYVLCRDRCMPHGSICNGT